MNKQDEVSVKRYHPHIGQCRQGRYNSLNVLIDHTMSFNILMDHSMSFNVLMDHSISFNVSMDHSMSFNV